MSSEIARGMGPSEVCARAVCGAREAVSGENGGLLRPGQELIVTKWIALAGTAKIANAYEEELKKRYPASLVDAAKRFADSGSTSAEEQIAARFGDCALYALGESGILGALWETAEYARVGLEVDLRKIPIRQETVEICEYFDLNPYYLYSEGSFLIGTNHPGALIEALAEAGISAAVIGYVTSGRKRIVRNGAHTGYLNRPQPDELCRRFGVKLSAEPEP